MKNRTLSACGVSILGLLFTVALSGCGGVSSGSATTTPTPPGATPTPTPAAARGTFIYFNNSNAQTAGYKLNGDGTLTLLSGSPFAVSGGLAAAGSFLAVSSGNTVSTYLVDPSSGALTKAASGSVVQGGSIVADASNVYLAGNIPASTATGIYGFALSANGALTPLAGSPYTFTQACDFCDVPFALALNNNFLIQGGVGFHGVGDFTVYTRGGGGVLGKAQILGTDAEERVAIQHPAGNFSYALNTDDSSLSEFTTDATGKPAPGSQVFTGTGQDLAVDSTGRFLLVVDNTGVVHVFAINSSNGSMSQIGTSEAAGNGAVGISIDPSGRFVVVSQSAGSTNLAGAANQITVFTFDSGTGAMKKLQSYPQPKAPGAVVMIAR
ncbi:MAG TPA: hypothetical protein VFT65_09040 [Candidatus Angelobacter sp.]|nr:hypothetical protein [Candidatus Angelobacter sp.]